MDPPRRRRSLRRHHRLRTTRTSDIVGETLDAQEEFGAIEAVKTTAELLMPVAGEILEVNEALADEENAKLVNSDPYGEAWIIKIKVNDVAELDGLLDAAAYEAKIG